MVKRSLFTFLLAGYIGYPANTHTHTHTLRMADGRSNKSEMDSKSTPTVSRDNSKRSSIVEDDEMQVPYTDTFGIGGHKQLERSKSIRRITSIDVANCATRDPRERSS